MRTQFLTAAPRWATAGLVITVLAAGLATSALAQPVMGQAAPTAPTAPAAQGPHGAHDPAKMQERMARHQAKLKAMLQITPAQEGAWTAYVAGTQRPAHKSMQMDRAQWAQLSTPDRIDRMRAARAEHAAQADQRGAAVKSFYAPLSPEQQKTMGAETARAMEHRHGHHHGHWNGGTDRPSDPAQTGAARPPA